MMLSRTGNSILVEGEGERVLLDPTTDQALFHDTTAQFLGELTPPDRIRELRDDALGFDADYWRRGAELGWTSLLVPESAGGGSIGEHGLIDLTLVAHEFGRHAAPGPLLPTNVVAALLAAAGTAEDTVQRLLAGTSIAAWCLAEPAPCDRLGQWASTVRFDGDDIVLNGIKRPVEAATAADVLLVTGTTGDRLVSVLVPAATPGVTITPMRSTDLTRRFGSVRLDGVRVPSTSLVGGASDSDADVWWGVHLALVITAAESVGAMQAALDMTVEWAFDRYAFGRPLASYQALKHRFADMASWLQGAHAIADAAATAVAVRSDDAGELTSAAAAFIGQYGPELAQDCIQIHGGIGVTFEHDLHLFLRRLVVNRSIFGSPAEHRARLADVVQSRATRKVAS